MAKISVLIAQLNYNPEDLDYNYKKILNTYIEAQQSADLILFSRYAMSGYIENEPILSGNFLYNCTQYIQNLALQTKNQKASIIIGSVINRNNFLHEIIYFIQNGNIKELTCTPIHYQNTNNNVILYVKQIRVLLSFNCKIDDDLNAQLLLIMDNTPYRQSLHKNYNDISSNKPIIYINLVGGYGNRVFYGGSFIYNKKFFFSLGLWKENKQLIYIPNLQSNGITHTISNNSSSHYQALMLSLKDYTYKNHFTNVLLGMSGGIDSSLVASIASDALGPNKVYGFMLPTQYTSNSSIYAAKECSVNLAINYKTLYIENIFKSSLISLQDIFINLQQDITEENLQSRIRGLILMAISNKFKFLLLSTGNKSELLTGYTTLYGDMCGGFAPIKDLYKTQIYKLVHWRNNNIPENSLCQKINIIPNIIINKPPSAELNYNQKDQDTLPEYSVLDSILELLVNKNYSKEEVINQGYKEQVVNYIISLVQKSSFKHKLSAVGPLIS
ncbi:NAD(+) synthase [Candidatus Neoehrlichia procyonis]|uniref:Glutamine-dependent NAD(+) synthetase n=1 Tax=Candidatus Neoehrlichia procyonis str. RAC413 TaxID=1359163 RepID=A0A0F3NLV0_9RICK|nr:NAD(+) synthase [Candidatus Neoehrlichia lotoris]KJV68667.1 NAD+ synthetase [Candidatus Neoehrlichia lotoris str. RAC413]